MKVQLSESRKHKDLTCSHVILQGSSIKNLEAGSDGRVAGVKLGDGSTIEADTVIRICLLLLVFKKKKKYPSGYAFE